MTDSPSTARPTPAPLAASIIFGAARVALGVLWLLEGITKFRAHFGAADILLVTDNAATVSRIPDFFAVFADSVMRPLAGLFGFGIPLLETGLGVALILGVFTLPAALGSVLTLLLYWSSDQLIDQYPIMAALSVAVIAWPAAAARFSVTSLALRLAQRRPAARPLGAAARRWV